MSWVASRVVLVKISDIMNIIQNMQDIPVKSLIKLSHLDISFLTPICPAQLVHKTSNSKF